MLTQLADPAHRCAATTCPPPFPLSVAGHALSLVPTRRLQDVVDFSTYRMNLGLGMSIDIAPVLCSQPLSITHSDYYTGACPSLLHAPALLPAAAHPVVRAETACPHSLQATTSSPSCCGMRSCCVGRITSRTSTPWVAPWGWVVPCPA